MTHSEAALRRAKMARQIKQGRSVREVSEEFQVHPTTVVVACKENGVPVPRQSPHPCGRSRNNGFMILAELMKKDVSIPKIVRELETTRRRITQVLCAAKNCGIPGLEHRFKPESKLY